MCKTERATSEHQDLKMVDGTDSDSGLAEEISDAVALFLAGRDIDTDDEGASDLAAPSDRSNDAGHDDKDRGDDRSDTSDAHARGVLQSLLEETRSQKTHRRPRGRRGAKKAFQAEDSPLAPSPGTFREQDLPLPVGSVQRPVTPPAPQQLQPSVPAGAVPQSPQPLQPTPEAQDPTCNVPASAMQHPPSPVSSSAGKTPQRLHLSEMLLDTSAPVQPRGGAFSPCADPGLLQGRLVMETMRRAKIHEGSKPSQEDLAVLDAALRDSIKCLFNSGTLPTVPAVQQCMRTCHVPEDLVQNLTSLCSLMSERYCFWVGRGAICIVSLDAPLDPLPSHILENFEATLADVLTKRLAAAATCSQVLPPQIPQQLSQLHSPQQALELAKHSLTEQEWQHQPQSITGEWQ
eukprot:gb/GFBE01006593.1/.p1 GENE.gb/GFBE01006593.1/~~gb/GFBE01006593.1/.p1  ORF type:complete len:404 (+),score=82.10 gb/GFBE01006593.1/:1-1212(+)